MKKTMVYHLCNFTGKEVENSIHYLVSTVLDD